MFCRKITVFAVLILMNAATLAPGIAVARRPSGHELRAGKHGRIVDVDTGKGIPDAKVIALWEASFSGIADTASGGAWCELQKVVTTGADGSYVLPDVSKELDLSARGTHIGMSILGPATYSNDNSWRLIVFKPGYVRIGKDVEYSKPRNPYVSDQTHDDRKVLQHLMTGSTEGCQVHTYGCMDRFLWNDGPPDTDGNIFGSIAVKPIAMKKMELPAPQAWLYGATIQRASRCMDRMAEPNDSPEFTRITEAMNGSIRPRLSNVCSMHPETEITLPVLKSFVFFVQDNNMVDRIIDTVGRREWNTKGTTAGVLCGAFNGKESTP